MIYAILAMVVIVALIGAIFFVALSSPPAERRAKGGGLGKALPLLLAAF